MKKIMSIVGLALLAGCGGTWSTGFDAPVEASVARSWHVHDINVVVPDTLTVSEANSLAPNADIVWHGDPAGDRKAQVAAIMEDGIARGTNGLNGPVGVNLEVVLVEFHALSPSARNRAPSAVHNITYTIQAVDEQTGRAVTAPTVIRADLEAFTGAEAQRALTRGETQKVRITRHLQAVTMSWLGTGPDVRQDFSTVGR